MRARATENAISTMPAFSVFETCSQMPGSDHGCTYEYREDNACRKSSCGKTAEPKHADWLRTCLNSGQKLELQTEALQKAGCKKIFEDRISVSRAERPGLVQAQDSLREGDTLVFWKLDRLGRSVKHLVDFVGELRKQGVQFKSLTDSTDTGTASGRFSFT